MIFDDITSLLFDDKTILKNSLGDGFSKIPSMNANCDCAGYTSIDDDNDTEKSTRAVAAAY